MPTTDLSERDRQIRHCVYTFFVERGQAPTYEQAAQQFGLAPEGGRLAYRRLHEHHAPSLARIAQSHRYTDRRQATA
jgi:hypothetical protein